MKYLTMLLGVAVVVLVLLVLVSAGAPKSSPQDYSYQGKDYAKKPAVVETRDSAKASVKIETPQEVRQEVEVVR